MQGPGNDGAGATFRLRDSANTEFALQIIDMIGVNPISVFPGALPLQAGEYKVLNSAVGLSGTSGDIGWAADYIWRFTVTSVPEPSTLLLLGTGLAAVGYRRRRK